MTHVRVPVGRAAQRKANFSAVRTDSPWARKRYDIQGLRALAVGLVIADHLLGYPTGGFIGVDVFFVISGFVITASLIREHEKSGRISFADFYRRRARRILPLASVVIVLSLVASWAVFSTARFVGIAQDGLWAFLSAANWHLAMIGTDYMQAGGVVSPLQHYWSLAVEEQFYIVWPWLIVLMLGWGASRRGRSSSGARRSLGLAVLAAVGASFVFAMWESSAAPTVAYFSTFSRAWELGCGGLLAVIAPVLLRIPDRIRPALAYTGLAGIAVGALAMAPDLTFPGPWAAVPVLATMAVISAGTGGEQRLLAPLTNRVSRYLGDISYSLYLWHFPVIILLEALRPSSGVVDHAVALALILALSAWSYHFIEEPVRHSQWLEPKAARAAKAPHGAQTRTRLAYAAVITLALAAAIVVGFTLVKATPVTATAVRQPVVSPGASNTAAANTPSAKLSQELTLALSASQWPELTPAIDTLGDAAKAPEWVEDGCLGDERGALEDPAENAARCVYGDEAAKKTAVVLGDSVAISYVPGIRAALEPQGYKIHVYTMQQCPSAAVDVIKASKSAHPKCAPFRTWALQQIASMKPDMVISSSSTGTLARLASGATGGAAADEWSEASKKLYTELSASAKQVFVLDPPPRGRKFAECATKISTPANCASKVQQLSLDMTAAGRSALDPAELTNVHFVETVGWFCVAGSCPAFAGTSPMHADGAHLTAAYSTSLGPVLSEALAIK
ncbi:putative acetyltransferase [Arthrobacter globiformis NBRC 12137]|uniref:Putative acetyltransferase n=1 Tax=Arthrobacter globiformis (strain ATCC 8010 / DSM 20124 / JCM 1332 / NBRC 12137 / NCIMB 8907 / NRRL B-2979 / 168) TaxID=1077972 RepID=H0QNB7_ARTG1|nr:acyltransferase family protein [Arthrobacter globiformis]GAB14318.1 putative acetyltransferase [Arthrobacter globiformis NBRC 12137]